MNKSKFLLFLSLGLFFTNLFLIWFFVFNPPSHYRGLPKNIIIQKLHFDENQRGDYENLIHEHQREIRKYNDELMALKKDLYAGLRKENPAATKDSLISEIEKIQIAIENTHYSHFQDIKSLCKPEQMEAFNRLTLELSRIFTPKRPPRH